LNTYVSPAPGSPSSTRLRAVPKSENGWQHPHLLGTRRPRFLGHYREEVSRS
jgi:hypothetical protein